MIGFLKPNKLELLLKDCLYYKLYYCSICRHLVRKNFRAYAFLNSYEGTLLAMLYNEMVVRDMTAFKDRCSGLPIAKVAALPADHEAIELGAFVSMLAFLVKFQDNLADESGYWITAYNQFFLDHLKKNFSQKQKGFAKFNIDLQFVRSSQEDLTRLEKNETLREIDVFLDRWADIFSYIMTQPFKEKIETDRYNGLTLLFKGLGRIINLMDAMSDVHEDHRNNKFNLLLRVEPLVFLDNEKTLNETYSKYLKRIQSERETLLSTLPRLQLNESFHIVYNLLTHCLDKEMKKVFELMVLRKQNNEKTLFNCKEF